MKTPSIILTILTFLFLMSCSETIVKELAPDNGVDAPAVTGYFKKHVLIEDYTGTWCGFCARVAYGIDQVQTVTDKAVVVSIHGGNPNSDPYITPYAVVLFNYFFPTSPGSYPKVRLNRTEKWTNPEALNLNDVKNLTGNNSGLGLAIKSNIVSGNLVVDTKIKLAQTYSSLRLVVYVVESGLVFDQVNYTSYYNSQNPVPNFVHNHVLRESLTSVFGNDITESTVLGQTIIKNYYVPLPINIANPAEIGIVAFVIDANNTVINSRYAKINENQAFEEN
jgi:Outer membrane protein Omp28